MLVVGPAMDGQLPQREPPPAGGTLYSPHPLQTPLCGPGVQVSLPRPQRQPGRRGGEGHAAPGAAAAAIPAWALSGCPSPHFPGRTLRGAQLPPSFSDMSHWVSFTKVGTGP